jgi:hypothetical protein
MSNVMSFETGTIFLASGTSSPASLVLRGDSVMSGWGVIENSRSTVDKEMNDAGWNLFFLAGEISATVFGFDDQKLLAAGLRRLARTVKALKCNSFEIAHVVRSAFLGVSRVSLSGHARHLQKGTLLFGE